MTRTPAVRRRAFTLLELIVVVTILGVLAAIAVPTFDTVRTESRDRALSTTADAFVRSVRAAAASDGSGGVVSAAHLASALSELPEGTAHVVTSDSEVVFVLADRQVVVSASGGAVSVSQPSPCAQASGGDDVYDIVVDGVAYRVHVFSTVGASTFMAYCDVEVEFLVVGGGGAGGWFDGAGGAGGGGVLTNVGGAPYRIPAGSAAVTVGAGGESLTSHWDHTAGSDSSLGSLIAFGGGQGSSRTGVVEAPGGSGGGGQGDGRASRRGGRGVVGQGNDGGDGAQSGGNRNGGGGGGAGGPGTDATLSRSGDGGAALAVDITGSVVFYGGGSAGGSHSMAYGSSAMNAGFSGDVPTDAVDGTGGGGGSSRNSTGYAGDGGDGVVVIRYRR